MGLIILLVIGATLGWLASIVLRQEESQRILVCIALGSLGAVVGGLLSNSESILAGISPTALLIAVVSAIALLGIYGLFRNQLSNG